MSDISLQPYLFFAGRTEEAIEFYRGALNAEVVMMMRYSDSPEPSQMPLPPNWDKKIMHANIKFGNNQLLMSDGCGDEKNFDGFALSLTLSSEAEAKRVYNALSAGGEPSMPLTKTFFSPAFGMLRDRFGVNWMVMVPGQQG
jgi:PhnB protein